MDTEWLRPVLHFSPKKYWMNDPNGLYFDGSLYHMFFQCNPSGNEPGNLSWGYATSADLCSWSEKEPALLHGDVFRFSGSCVIDHENCSGLGGPGAQPTIALYTGYNPETQKQDQRIAHRSDHGAFNDYSANPILDVGETEFRDPKVFWHHQSKAWIMVVVFAARHEVAIYRSVDLKAWDEASRFSFLGDGLGGEWECPDLFELRVADTDEWRWVLKVDVGSGARFGGSGAKAFVGSFDGWSFVADAWDGKGALERWVDGGWDFYAAQSFSGLARGEVIWIGWANNWAYAQDLPTYPWRGLQSLARKLGLVRRGGSLWLTQVPVLSDKLPTGLVDICSVDDGVCRQISLREGSATLATLIPTSSLCSISVQTSEAVVARFEIDFTQGALLVHRDGPSEACAGRVSEVAQSFWAHQEGFPTTIQMVIDHSIIELFSIDGALVATVVVCPELPLAMAEVRGAEVAAESFKISIPNNGHRDFA